MNISITKSDTKNNGTKLKEYVEDFGREIEEFSSIIESINTAWSGSDSLKYINTMRDKYVVGLNQMKDILEEYGNYLYKVSDAYSSLDEAFSSKSIDA